MKKAREKELGELAERLIAFARKCGADEVEVTVSDDREFSLDVRLGKIENLVEASSRALALKVIKDKKTAFAASSDLNKETLKRLIKNAVARAELANEDECAGLPLVFSDNTNAAGLDLFDPEIRELEPDKKICLALETERIALKDKRITNSHGASLVTNEILTVLANSRGFAGSYEQTFCSLSVGLQAGETDNKAEDYWFSTERFFKKLEPPESVARRAVERTVRLLNPRKIKTQAVPVIFEPQMTAWLLGFLFACISGIAVYQKATFLAGRLGTRIGNKRATVIDNGLMPGRLGSRPFDTEGVACQKTTVLDRGILRHHLCNTYAGRKLDHPSTGNADGAGVSPNNFYLVPGDLSPQEIIASTERGFILTRTIGHGLNPATGDISRGAFGLWVEKGEVVYPVAEVTVSGNLENILRNIEAVGNDLDFRTAVCGPTIKVAELVVAGE
ncbi:MAG: TldD/PmbA family protein [Clostridiales bacterium]|nr:TldD/PmbA family protein [Clostridiales bacterium]